MSKIKIIDESYTDVTRESTRDGWDSDDTYTSHDIKGFGVVGTKDYSDLDTPFEIDKNKTYYLVYALYSTGDSFHQEEGRIDFIDLYENKDLAEKVQKLIEVHYEKYKQHDGQEIKGFDPRSIGIINAKGIEYKISPPWIGYFECLTSVNIQPVNHIK